MSEFITREHNLESGEIVDREMTPQEIQMHHKIKSEADLAILKAAEIAAKRQAILEKLGITEEEAKLLLG